MGNFGKIEDRFRAQALRRQGLSYKEILTKIFVSKSTISLWCRDILLTEKQKFKLLSKKQFGQRKGSLVAAENKRIARIERTRRIRSFAKKDVGTIINRDKFIAGIALYSAEGNKSDGKAGFSNANPKLIKFMMDWFLAFAKVPMDKMRGAIWLHEGLSDKDSKNFWANLIGLPVDQFNKTYVSKVKNHSRKIRKNIHPYGVLQIRFSDSDIHRKIMGWISAVFDGKI